MTYVKSKVCYWTAMTREKKDGDVVLSLRESSLGITRPNSRTVTIDAARPAFNERVCVPRSESSRAVKVVKAARCLASDLIKDPRPYNFKRVNARVAANSSGLLLLRM